MILYQNDAIGFRNDVEINSITDSIENTFIEHIGHKPMESERRAWNHSMHFMEIAIRKSNIPNSCGVLIEYNIPSTGLRIDFIISGHDNSGNSNFIIIELKQWNKALITDKEDLVIAPTHGSVMEETNHPSYQAFSYKRYLSDMNEAICSDNLYPFSCAYLHNYPEQNPEPLTSVQYAELIEDTPIFFQNDTKKLEAFIRKYVGKGKGMDILYEIEHGRIKPSKKLIEYISAMFDGKEVYTLLDNQKIAYSNIIKYATAVKDKTTIIINGGPGTGKSVVAMNAFIDLLKQEKNIRFVAPNASFKEAMVEMLANGKSKSRSRGRIKYLFSGSSVFYQSLSDEFDVIICDEAHRLKAKGTYMYQGESQVEDIIRASKINVFFIDDNQRIRPNDEGTITKLKSTALKFNSTVVEVELKAQFRCSGADGFINWLTHNLQIEDTANYDGWDTQAFDFKIMDSPQSLVERVRLRNNEGFKSRILAGFAWPWTSEKDGNTDAQANDVSMPEFGFEMPWNSRSNQYSWSIDNLKQNQIGCVHTSQGLEFDYVGVIIGNDLRYNPETNQLYASFNDYYDSTGKKGLRENPLELMQYIKNIYKILMSRGIKGCYIFCRDKNLQEYLKKRLK